MKKLNKWAFLPINGYYCPKFNRFAYTASLFAIVLGIFLLPKTAFMATITPDKIIALTNDERAHASLNILTVNSQLTQAANAKAQAILSSQVFDHTINGRRFSSWIKDTGYQYTLVGENLAIDFITSEGLMRAWMASPEHRSNILEADYTQIGVGVAEGRFDGQNTIVVAQLFGDPLIKAAPIPTAISALNERISPWNQQTASRPGYLTFCQLILARLSLATAEESNFF